MPYARDEAGNIWETDAQGNALRLSKPAGAPQGGRQATVISNPFRARDEGRKDEDQEFQRRADARAAEAEARAREDQARQTAAEQRARDKDADAKRTLDARGGVETTEAERTAAFLATRLAGGLRDIKTLGAVPAPSLKDAVFGGTLLGNYTTDEKRQRTINAQREVLDAALTLGTGAAYTQEQLDNYRTAYFPQPGDKPETIADKSRRLQTALNAARLKAGASAGMIDEALAPVQNATPAAPADPNGLDAQGFTAKERQEGITGSTTDESPAAPTGTPPSDPNGGYANSYLGQGMYGANEGFASTLGLPVDAATMALNLVPKGINAIANTELPEIQNPFLGGEWWKGALTDLGSIGPTSQDADKQFARRVGQSVGAAAVPIAGTATTGTQIAGSLLAGLGGGVGAATAQQIAPGNAGAEIIGELLGGGVGGGASLLRGRNLAQREIEAAVPTIQDLKGQATSLYQQAEQRGVTASPQQTQQFADDFRTTLRDEGQLGPAGRITNADTSTNKALNLVEQYQGLPMRPTEMDAVRGVLAEGRGSMEPSDRRMAELLTNQFDDWARPMAPEFDDARAVSSRYLQAQDLERARELAAARAGQFSGSGFENALRTEYRGLDRGGIKGQNYFADPVVEAIQKVSRGTTGSNLARGVGKLAPTGVVSGGTAIGVPFAIGSSVGGPAVGGALAAATAGAGIVGRRAATQMGIRQADIAELLARNGAPLGQAQAVTPETSRIIAAMLAAGTGGYLNEGQ